MNQQSEEIVIYQGQGTVRWFHGSKGYGFICYDVGSSHLEEAFVHFSSINMDGYKLLYKGQRVSLKVVRTEKGLQAKDVSLITQSKNLETITQEEPNSDNRIGGTWYTN